MTYIVFAYLLEHADVNPMQRTSLHVIAAVAPALALVTSWMNWSQYAKSVLLRRQLKRSNEALVAQQQELAFLADHDVLTGLYNRREFIRLAQMELLRANRIPCDTAVIMVDLDFFKKVNDRYGHPGGDAVLKATAVSLTRTLRATDTLARLGGEEFIVLLPATGQEGALQVAAKMRDAVRNTSVELGGDAVSVTASFGVSSLPAPHVGSVDALYAAADRALYVAKQLGRNRVEYATPEGSELHAKAEN
jgi:diguanylate cyclase (GGDEF)-like protein